MKFRLVRLYTLLYYRGKGFSVRNPLHLGKKLKKEQKQGRDETTKLVEKRHKKITLHLLHVLGRRETARLTQ